MLTKKQLELLNLIHKRTLQDGIVPSFDEMKKELDLRSKSGIHRLISALEERGFIRKLPHRARSIEILRMPEVLGGADAVNKTKSAAPPHAANDFMPDYAVPHSPSIRLMGRIAAGVPISAIENYRNEISVPHTMVKQKAEHYALEVQGDSMINAGINNGDVVVIRKTNTAQNGDIVVALVEDQEATLKRFQRHNDAIALEAANPAFKTQVFNSDQIKVQGKLVGLIRTY